MTQNMSEGNKKIKGVERVQEAIRKIEKIH